MYTGIEKQQKTNLDFSAMVEVEHRHIGAASGDVLYAFRGYLSHGDAQQ